MSIQKKNFTLTEWLQTNSAQLRGRASCPVKRFAGFRLTHVWSSSRNSNCRFSAGLARPGGLRPRLPGLKHAEHQSP